MYKDFTIIQFGPHSRMSSSEAQASNLIFSRALKDVATGGGGLGSSRDRAAVRGPATGGDRSRVSVVNPLRPPSNRAQSALSPTAPEASASGVAASASGASAGVSVLQLDASAVLGANVPLVSANIGGVTGLFALTPISSLGSLVPPSASALASPTIASSALYSSSAQPTPQAINSMSIESAMCAISPSRAAAGVATLASPYVAGGGGLASGITISFNPAELRQQQQQKATLRIPEGALERQRQRPQYASGYGVPPAPAEDADQLYVGETDESAPLLASSASGAVRSSSAGATRFIVTIEGAPSHMKQATSRAAKRAQATAANAASAIVSASGQRLSAKERLGTLKRRGGISLQGKQAPTEQKQTPAGEANAENSSSKEVWHVRVDQ